MYIYIYIHDGGNPRRYTRVRTTGKIRIRVLPRRRTPFSAIVTSIAIIIVIAIMNITIVVTGIVIIIVSSSSSSSSSSSTSCCLLLLACSRQTIPFGIGRGAEGRL